MAVVLATGGFDSRLRLWEATTGICTRSIRITDSQVNCLAISRDKRFLASGGNPAIHVFDVGSSTDAPMLTYDGHTSNVMSVGFQRDGKWMFSCSEDNTVKIWDLRAPTCQRDYNCGRRVNSCVLHPNQGTLISGDDGGSVRMWDLRRDACVHELVPIENTPIRAISMANDASMLAAASHSSDMFVWTPDDSAEEGYTALVRFKATTKYLLDCAVSPDARTIATCGSDAHVRLWSVEEGFQETAKFTGHTGWVWDLVWSADAGYLVSASADHTAKLWDVRTGQMIRNYSGHSLAITAVALNDIA